MKLKNNTSLSKETIYNICKIYNDKIQKKLLEARNDFKTYAELVSKTIDDEVDYNHNTYRYVFDVMQYVNDNNIYVLINGEYKLCKDIFFNACPGWGKSSITTLLFNTWLIGKNNNFENYICTASDKARTSFSLKLDSILKSNKYKEIFKDVVLLSKSVEMKRNNKNSLISLSPSRSTITGGRGNLFCFDDFFNPAHIQRQEHITTKNFLDMFLTRTHKNPNKYSIRLYIEQRIDFEDTTGYLTERYKKGNIPYYHIIIPYKFTEDTEYSFYIKEDGVFKEKKYFFKANTFSSKFFNQEKWDKDILYKDCKGDVNFRETQFQQRPIQSENAFLRREYFLQRYDSNSINLVSSGFFEKIYISMDSASKTKKNNDYSAFCCIGVKEGIYYVLDVIRVKETSPILFEVLRDFYFSWNLKNKPVILIEDKSSGEGLIQRLKKEGFLCKTANLKIMPSVIPIIPKNTKESRLMSVIEVFKTNRVLLPKNAKWLIDFELELFSFPFGKNDDQLDALINCLKYIEDGNEIYQLKNIAFI